ncbi:MAG TPA: glycosyltransferase family 2 protein [Steroidobacteraceae bacterium]|nr:glycosyltransferase family 2 protein [Steroidobacteraceae bacterium]
MVRGEYDDLVTSAQNGAKAAVSALILTLNEEINIAACLDSLSWCDDIVVLDSLSTDRTCAIARERGARVVERAFDNWSTHQNWAVANIEFRHPWVLYLDADERCDSALREEVVKFARPEAREAAFRVRRKDFFMGHWLKHAQLYPTWLVRLFRPQRIRYERLVNPVAVVDGQIGALAGHIVHYPFSHGVSHWIARHNRYSDMEAIEAAKVREEQISSGSLWSRDPNERRRAMKDVFFRMPARPLVKFLYYYGWRRGFLDGRAGFTYATLQAIYEYMIACKGVELERRRRGLPV